MMLLPRVERGKVGLFIRVSAFVEREPCLAELPSIFLHVTRVGKMCEHDASCVSSHRMAVTAGRFNERYQDPGCVSRTTRPLR